MFVEKKVDQRNSYEKDTSRVTVVGGFKVANAER